MRISLHFYVKSLILPVHYNHIVQAFIYHSLDTALATFFHEKGYPFLKRNFKLFTFSRLMSKEREFLKRTREIVFKGRVCLKIGSMDDRLLESMATYLIKRGFFYLGDNLCEVGSVNPF